MSLLRTDTRYAIDTMISIAKITGSSTLRENLLEEALEILRSGVDEDDTFGVSGFINRLEPSTKDRIRAGALYDMYCEYCLENGNKVAMRKILLESVKDSGFRVGTLHGYTVLYARVKDKDGGEI